MFTIGDFAKYGRVSVRMLRHYDAIGLLPPARVDAASGYRYYEAGQLARLNRIVALKGLGLRLDQIGPILDEQVGVEELRGMLRLRRLELENQLTEATDRLRQVEARLRVIEREGAMPTNDVVLKSLPPTKVVQLTAIAASYGPQDISPVIGPLFDRLCTLLGADDVPPVAREVSLHVPADHAEWVTELQEPVVPAADGPGRRDC